MTSDHLLDAADVLGLPEDLRDRLVALTSACADELVALRRDLHAHPELGRAEFRTTIVLRDRLRAAGLTPRVLPGGTGVLCDVGHGPRVIALRADIDALPVPDAKDVPYRSQVEGLCHACGHDVHTAVLLGCGLVLAELARSGDLPGRVRLVFQPAEELAPGGALDVVAAGGLEDVERIFALHCDPRLEVGRVGVRVGPITAAADRLLVRVGGPGGHTARPHLTVDLVHVLATVARELPLALSRVVDPRAGLSVVWGRIGAGAVANAIPRTGEVEGTVRCLDSLTWHEAPELVARLVASIVSPYGAQAEVTYDRTVPPVVNDETCCELTAGAVRAVEGEDALTTSEQSLGGEDFAWYLERVPGALARLGVADADDPVVRDLHQGWFDVDERAIGVGVRTLVASALGALALPVPG